MGAQDIFEKTSLAQYVKAIREMPREILWNRHLVFTAIIYAMCGVSQTWEQGASATLPSLKSFTTFFGLKKGASGMQDLVSIIYIGFAVGAAASSLINNRLGRRWSYRLYIFIYIIGQTISIFSPNTACLYAARIISGIGIGSLVTVGPIALVEIAPAEIRGLIVSWYSVCVGLGLVVANFCVYGVYLHMAESRLQYQVVWLVGILWMLLCALLSFFVCESPRWLMLVDRPSEAAQMLVRLRGLPLEHHRVQRELREIENDIYKSRVEGLSSFKSVVRETFTKSANLRRLQQVLVAYALAQLSGANSVTSYLVPIMKLIGASGDTAHSIFLSGMYGLTKMFFSIMASFFCIDLLGRRKSLFIGCSIQMITHIYLGVYLKESQSHPVSTAASQTALAALFVHAFGWAIGLLVLPYVFGSEVWPNSIRSFGSAFGASFHWLFYFAIKYSVPPLLEATNNWGAFIFFAGWCCIAIIYVFFMVPEIAGLSVEEIDDVFKGPWFKAYKQSRGRASTVDNSGEADETIWVNGDKAYKNGSPVSHVEVEDVSDHRK